MSTSADIEAALCQALPPGQQHAAAELARLVEDAREGRLTQAQAQARLNADQSLGDALRALAGKQVKLSSSVIAFGSGAQMGDVTISGDVAGGNIVKLSLNLGVQQTINVSGQARIEKVVGEEHNTYYTYSAPTRSPQDQRNRRAMLTKVKNIWIDGLLNKSLTDELRIELDLTDRPDAVDIPLNAVVQELNQPPRELPPGVPISTVFDDVGGELLILGAPGAGKTTLLLELLRDLLQRAERTEAHPVPVMFPLSTWATERKPLKDWLVDQLNVIYDVPRKIGQGWVDENEVLPLLDGLDEVSAEHRNACVETINKYRQEVGGLAPTAAVSRIADYEALKGKLRLRGAVLVEALTREQVKGYLARVKEPLRAVRELVESDPEVVELLDSPLMLSVVTLAFQDASPEMLRIEGTPEERRGRLWEAYIERMFARKMKETKYSRQQTMRWLTWLAYQLVRHILTLYSIEGMQPTWLQQHHQWWYKFVSRLVVRLVVGLSFGLVVSLPLGLVGALVGGPFIGLVIGLFVGLVFGLGGGLLGVLLSGLSNERIKLVEEIRWSWSEAWSSFRSELVSGLVSGLSLGLVSGLVLRQLFGLAFGLGDLLFFALLFALSSGLLSGLGSGRLMGLSTKEVEVRTIPNQGIRASISNGLLSGLVGGLLGGLVSVLVLGLVLGLVVELVGGLVGGLVFGLVLGLVGVLPDGLRYGGNAAIQHYILRYLLYRQGSLPFRDLIPWLDHCVDRLFLRRVGGGYIFIHRMLLEHFARKYEEQTKEAQRGEGT